MLRSMEKIVKRLRQFRWLHKVVGVGLAFFVLVTSVTGILLGWKKDVAVLQPITQVGKSKNMEEWISLDAIARAAVIATDSATGTTNAIDRMDVRPDKGIVKVLFTEGYWEAQVDGKTGIVFSVARRHADWIEHVHDGSILNDFVKLIYTNILGIGLMVLAVSGLWLWFGPKIIRKMKNKQVV